ESTSLRTHTSAAPLKRTLRRAALLERRTSPHSHECGSVEAPSDDTTSALRSGSPHSHECGSVEACGPRSRVPARGTSLRTHTSAAPLKRRPMPVGPLAPRGSPHSHECGSVEAPYHLRQGTHC